MANTKKHKLFHSWGDWVYDRDNCKRYRKCKRKNCQECYDEEPVHDYGEWEYISENSCEMIRKCKVYGCNEVEKKTEHAAWEEAIYRYIDDKTCRSVKRCSRCNEAEEKDMKHSFDKYKHHTTKSCSRIRHCINCGFVDPDDIQHSFGKEILMKNICITESVCKECGFKKYSIPEHKWTKVHSYKECFNEVIKEKEQQRATHSTSLQNTFTYDKITQEIEDLKQQLSFLNDTQLGRYCTHCLKLEYWGDSKNMIYHKGFLSYNHNEKNLADDITKLFKNNSVDIIRDVNHLRASDNIFEFMCKIEYAEFVVFIVSESYMMSKNCMIEAVKATKNIVKNNIPFFAFVCNINISSKAEKDKWILYWQNQRTEIERSNCSLEEKEIYFDITDGIDKFLDILSGNKYCVIQGNNRENIKKQVAKDDVQSFIDKVKS